ncbi:hypothetical protein GCM10010218_23960 [Streptomyces mashuensis]|uniref:Uncharacterized protein n=1 Tax=Streptomyces mashuensis TaxID=33904 RepID=A0A919B210_9ACTN|nr:hypothetical protein [Streptomyces mashuensis]GHF42062.1 hypothetical protein GCM10010218_23960 [Streptomyces mashuensis]
MTDFVVFAALPAARTAAAALPDQHEAIAPIFALIGLFLFCCLPFVHYAIFSDRAVKADVTPVEWDR